MSDAPRKAGSEPAIIVRMTDGDAFRRAIIEAPWDDAPRLVYADWLEERGDPRAEFIRLQVAGTGSSARANDLLQAHWRAWVSRSLLEAGTELVVGVDGLAVRAPFRAGRLGLTCRFDRGFIGVVSGPYRGLMAKPAQALFAVEPVTTAVPFDRHPHIRNPPSKVRDLVAELAARDGVPYAADALGLIGRAVVLWHRRRLGLPDPPAAREV
ncbi:MAG TPA: TIGR02996 domain-containing protein [Gemmataceae bacterium]|jgi:uncharacterized protein (TIGR02996 family)|nr:TIGR02996 domain-containing protein [Gemmataceae bacterium]